MVLISDMATLNTTSDVIDAIGGVAVVADLFSVTEKAVKHWKYGQFPAHTYLDILEELGKRGLMADVSLWNFTRTATPRRKCVEANQ